METNYKEMYLELFNRISAVIEELEEIQHQTEKMYIESDTTRITS